MPAGTPPYMSPELWAGGPAGAAGDLYAATCVFFECLNGRTPYGADHRRRSGLHRSGRSRWRSPDSLRDLLARAGQGPGGPVATARQFAAELEEDALAGYGPDWEKRGRRHLGELATLLALRFPLAKTDTPTATLGAVRGRRITVPKLPPHLWIAGATAVAVLIAVVLRTGGWPPARRAPC